MTVSNTKVYCSSHQLFSPPSPLSAAAAAGGCFFPDCGVPPFAAGCDLDAGDGVVLGFFFFSSLAGAGVILESRVAADSRRAFAVGDSFSAVAVCAGPPLAPPAAHQLLLSCCTRVLACDAAFLVSIIFS